MHVVVASWSISVTLCTTWASHAHPAFVYDVYWWSVVSDQAARRTMDHELELICGWCLSTCPMWSRYFLAFDRHLRSKCSSLHITRSSAESSLHHQSSSSLSSIRSSSHFLSWQTTPRATSPVSHGRYQARFLRISFEIFIIVSASFAFGPMRFISLFSKANQYHMLRGRPTNIFETTEKDRQLRLLDVMLYIILELHRIIDSSYCS